MGKALQHEVTVEVRKVGEFPELRAGLEVTQTRNLNSGDSRIAAMQIRELLRDNQRAGAGS